MQILNIGLRFLGLIGISVGLVSCGKGSDTATTTAKTPTTISVSVATASISGNVTSSVAASTSSGSRLSSRYLDLSRGFGFSEDNFGVQALTNDCLAGTFNGAYVGGGGTVAITGSFADGSFTIPEIQQKREMVLTFTCSGGSKQRCLAKSGDAGIYCNPIADAILAAFEAANGTAITDPVFDGKSIAKVGAAIVQAAQNDSTATAAFNAAILACKSAADVATCQKNAIVASPFGGAFKMMQTLVTGWGVDALFTLMVDVYGAEVDVDSFIYTAFASAMDTWFSTDFVAQTRAYIADVVADQLAGGSKYIIQVVCGANYSKYQGGGFFQYPPVMVTKNGFVQPSCKNTTALQKNDFTAAQITTIFTRLDSADENHNAIQLGTASCDGMGGWNDVNYYCLWPPRLQILSKFTEINRNDPLGTHGGDYYNKAHVGMINAFPELMTGLAEADKADPANCLNMAQNGPPSLDETGACATWFEGVMKPHQKNLAGLMGLYMYLKKPQDYGTGTSTLLSLRKIARIFSNEKYLNNRMAALGHNTCGAQVANNGGWLPALVSYTNGIFVQQSGFNCSYNGNSISMSEATAAVAAAAVPYSASFKMFENIPSTADIRNFVYGSAYHTDWNPTGQKMFWASAVKNYDIPIFCKMTAKDTGAPKEAELDSNTSISCLNKAQLDSLGIVKPDANGRMALPEGYPYTLQSWGYQGDGKGSLFALQEAKTGFQLRVGGRGSVLILQVSSGNEAGKCDGSSGAASGDVVTTKLTMGWGNDTRQQAVSVYCMDMSDFSQSGTFMLYGGGELAIKQINGDGTDWTWNAQRVGSRKDGNTTGAQLPICYYADGATGFSVDSASGLGKLNNAAMSGTGEISTALLGGDKIDLCSNSSNHTGTKYNIIMIGKNWQDTTRENLMAGLIADTTGAQILQWKRWDNTANQEWDDLLVFIRPSTLEKSLNNIANAANCPTATIGCVAPVAAQAPIMGLQLANKKWNAKFDPFCDDRNLNGYCDCFTAGTTNLKDPTTCSLLDDAAEPTMSNPPYWTNGQNANAFITLFNRLGGKAGADLVYPDANTQKFDGQYLQQNQLWFDTNAVFQCQYPKTSETHFRTPTWLQWDDFASLHHGGCPDSAGVIAESNGCPGVNCTGGGPVRMVKPVAAKNTYAINRPNTIIKLINYATKSVGQGIAINPDESLFAFDEALALVALRLTMPVLGIPVYQPGTSVADPAKIADGALLFFQKVWLNTGTHEEGGDMDLASAVLRAIVKTTELAND